MLKTWRKTRGNWVLGKNSDPLGRVRDMVINPDTGEIHALWVKTADGMKLLAISEIHRWHRDEIYTESPSDLISPEEFPRLKAVLDNEVPIINAPVFEVRDVPFKIGSCYDFTFESRSPRLLSIEVRQGWSFWQQKHLIQRTKIEEINARGIFVTSNLITEKEAITKDLDILPNAIPEAKTTQSFRSSED